MVSILQGGVSIGQDVVLESSRPIRDMAIFPDFLFVDVEIAKRRAHFARLCGNVGLDDVYIDGYSCMNAIQLVCTEHAETTG